MAYQDIIFLYNSSYPLIISVWGVSIAFKIIKRFFYGI